MVTMKQWILLTGLLVTATPAQAVQINDAAPRCQLPNFKPANAGIDLSQTKQHKATYVDFWASWCGPCQASFPFLQSLHQDFNDKGLAVIAVNVDEERQEAEAFLTQHPADFTIAADPQGNCPQQFQLAAMPSSYLIDRQGVIRHIWLGFTPAESQEIRSQVERLLNE